MTNVTLHTATRQCLLDNYFLGYEGENNINKLIFKFKDGFIDGLGQLYVNRGTDNGYVTLNKVGETYEFPVRSSLLSQVGDVKLQAVITKTDGTVVKYDVFTMTVKDAIDTDSELPEEYPSWQETIAEMLTQAQEAITQTENVSKQLLEDKENGVFDGKDGFSPLAKVTQTEEGAEIEITDENGTTKVVVRHGQGGSEGSGESGADGFSPIANVTQTDDGAIINITDKTGTSTAVIKNGKAGEKGDPGEPGKSGTDGLTPHIGENGNWWIGDTDTGVEAIGGGIAGGASYTETVLFDGEYTNTSDFSEVGLLSDSIYNYDLVYLTTFQKSNADATYTRIMTIPIDPKLIQENYAGVFANTLWVVNCAANNYSQNDGYMMQGNFGDGTQLAINRLTTQSGSTSRIHGVCKVVGVKFGSGVGGDGSPIGTIIPYMGTTAPEGFLVCDGAVLNIADYPNLATHFETQFGTKNHFGGDGSTTFAVPDLRNEFLRGYHCNGDEQLSGEDATAHPYFATDSNTHQIYHRDSGYPINADKEFNSATTAYTQDSKTISWSTNSHKTYSSRPTNVAVLYCIKYEETVSTGDLGGSEDNYSTTETKIGTWIDGKPIYRKVITGYRTLETSTDGTQVINPIDVSGLNVDSVVNLTGTMISSVGLSMVMPVFRPGSSYGALLFHEQSTKTVNISNFCKNFGDRDVTIIFEYTKTTD